jgi:predicted nucleic acid-binding protein
VAEARLVYLDASAFVKLVIPEPETSALVAALAPGARMVASEILEVEVTRAARRANRQAGVDAAREQLASVWLLPLSEQVRRRASELGPDRLRSLDAIHIATALDLGGRLDCMYVYDARMADAVQALGLHVDAPAATPPAEAEGVCAKDGEAAEEREGAEEEVAKEAGKAGR